MGQKRWKKASRSLVEELGTFSGPFGEGEVFVLGEVGGEDVEGATRSDVEYRLRCRGP